MSGSAEASKKYLALIQRLPLRPIHDEFLVDAASEFFGELVLKTDSRTPDENDYLTVLGELIREYEEENRLLTHKMTPQRALASLLKDNNLSQSELARKVVAPQSVISDLHAPDPLDLQALS